MDIKSLLSPQDTPVQTPGNSQRPPSYPTPTTSTPNGQAGSYTRPDDVGQHPQRMPPPPQHRHASTSMDTLADLASMQQYQASVRNASVTLRNPDLQSPINSPSIASNPQAGSYPPTPTRGRSVSYIGRQPGAPPARATPITTPLSEGDLPIMERPVLVGEESWVKKIEDGIMSSRTTQERVAVMETCAQAVAEEPYSPRLWSLYGDWMWLLYKRAFDVTDVYENCPLGQLELRDGNTLEEQQWSDDEKTIGREIFNWQQMMDTWRQGIEHVQWHLDNSNMVWDPYLELNAYALSTSPSPAQYNNTTQLFHQRLQIPHRTWDETKTAFLSFVSRYDEASIQQAISDASKIGQKFQSAYDIRAHRENTLQRAITSGDRDWEYHALEEYLSWEESQHRQKTFRGWGHNLYIALCQRATLRFPKDNGFWLDFVTFLMEPGHDQQALLDIAERATKYCHESGELWAQRLYAMEACGRPYKDIETVKHNATSSGQLEDSGNMQDLIRVEAAWCTYLRRSAFVPNADDDSKDVAEMAIRSAIENVARVGRDKYGDDYKGDPEFRVERIFLKFLAQQREFEQARGIFRNLEATHGNSHFFWERWYLWEMTVWETADDRSVQDRSQSIPTAATAALKRAMSRPNIDWPEKIVDMYLHHATQHETAKALLEAQVEVRRAKKKITKRRKDELQDYEQQQAAHQQPEVAFQNESNGKRGREDDSDMPQPKRARSEDAQDKPPFNDPSSSATSQIKRDRENTTVVARHLPPDSTEHHVRQFFRDCGDIKNVQVIQVDNGQEATATVEFESSEDVLTALTKSMKTLGSKQIEVQAGTGTTLFVTNYPAEADETYLRKLFGPYGYIVEVRFPSLSANTHRRFCYVQFVTAQQASDASAALHGKQLEHNHQITALISQPSRQKARVGATEEGREIYIGNFHNRAHEDDLRELVTSYGLGDNIETVRIPRNIQGRSKGAAFVVFKSKMDADAAVQKMDKQPFRERIVTVTTAKREPKTKTTTYVKARRGSTATSEASGVAGGGAGSPPSADTPMGDAGPNGFISTEAEEPRWQRNLALLNIPDTVNDARIQALCEPHGELVKIMLKPEHGGAIIEFEKAASKENARKALDGYEITPGNHLRIGTAGEVVHGAQAARGRGRGRGGTGRGGRGRGGLMPTSISRPHLADAPRGRERGGRPGLGFARAANTDQGGASAKSQNDFRAMLAGGGDKANDQASTSAADANGTGQGDVAMKDEADLN